VRFFRILVIIAGDILKRLVGQKLGDQFFSEKIREESHGGGGKPEN